MILRKNLLSDVVLIITSTYAVFTFAKELSDLLYAMTEQRTIF